MNGYKFKICLTKYKINKLTNYICVHFFVTIDALYNNPLCVHSIHCGMVVV